VEIVAINMTTDF